MTADRPTRDDETDEHEFGAPSGPAGQPGAELGGWQPPPAPGLPQSPAQPGPWQPAQPSGPSQAPAPQGGPGQWQSPQPGQWQSPPGYGAPGQWQVPPPAGQWAQMPYAAPDYGSSGMALLGAVVLIVMGALVGIISLFVLLIGLAGRELLELADPALGDFGPGLMTAIVVIAVIFIIVAVLHFVAGIGVLAHRTWARWLGIVIGVLGLVLGILAILGSVGDPTMAAGDWLVPVAWTVAYVLALVGLAGGGRQFERRYPYR